MNIYVVYDKKTGRVVQTASFYALGSDEPIARAEDDVLEAVARDSSADRNSLAVVRAPRDFDPRDRTKTLQIDVAKGACVIAERKRKGRTKAKTTGAR